MNNDRDIDSRKSDFEQRAGNLLRSTADALSSADRSRLNRARQEALAQLKPRTRRSKTSVLLPASGALVAVVIGVAVWFGALQTGSPDMPGTTEGYLPVTKSSIPADIDVLITDDSLELLEDLDFYNWLQSVPTGPVNGTV